MEKTFVKIKNLLKSFMPLNSQMLNEILDFAGKNFICLRCAECCYRWAVPLPEGINNPENHKCPYLVYIYLNGNKWVEAKCKIYKNRPEVCQKFKISFATICPIGLWKWLKLKEKNIEKLLPDRVEKILKNLKEEE